MNRTQKALRIILMILLVIRERSLPENRIGVSLYRFNPITLLITLIYVMFISKTSKAFAEDFKDNLNCNFTFYK
jgi:hypothetical protein